MDLKYFAILISCLIGLVSCQTTNYIDKDSKLRDLAEPQWFKDNVPFIELPDEQIEQVYYYRWSSHKRHLRYTIPGVGYSVTEFVHKVFYSQKFDSINAAAGHHIYESRWMRNPRFAEDYINFWAREGAANQQYSEWIADAAWATYLLTGNKEFIKSQQDGLVENFNGWGHKFVPALNMYELSPHDDAMEHSASSEQTDDPYHGGLGFRPSFNSELYANAIAISKIAKLNNDSRTAEEFEQRAAAIRQAILDYLWDDERTFFYHMYSENNPNNELLDTREEIGFFPWRFGVPTEDPKYQEAWKHLFDQQGFNSAYGPTTCEQRSPWFDGNQTAQCCWWNGNSWPYSTGHVINSLAAQIRNYGVTDMANINTFLEVMHKYAETQYKNDKPYVAECHSPYRKLWVCDSFNHSEHYAHSTYIDNVLGDLIGIEPQDDDSFAINPLMPSTWKFFALENLPYHGHNISVLYDADGTKYNMTGMKVFINGRLLAEQPNLGGLSVSIPPPLVDESYRRTKIENYAANVDAAGYPKVDASFNSIHSDVWQAVDGRALYDHIPSNRWTNFESPNEQDWFSIDFGPGRAKTISEVKAYIYSDAAEGHSVDCPTNVTVEIMASSGVWVRAGNQSTTPRVCKPSDVLTINFDEVKTQKVRLVFNRNQQDNKFVGMTEVEIWAPWPQVDQDGEYEAEDGYIVNANIRESDSASGGSYVGQIDENDASVEFTGVWVDEAKDYEVRVYYSNGVQDEATMEITVNNVQKLSATFPPTVNGWGRFDPETYVTLRIPLLRGNNAIIFKHGNNFVELDKVRIML